MQPRTGATVNTCGLPLASCFSQPSCRPDLLRANELQTPDGMPTHSDVVHFLPRRFRLAVVGGYGAAYHPTRRHLGDVG